ncbi:hypothetical protein G6F46_003463 [Rhizopus delemar]|uniref:Methyltransferase domain-containing protein n=2 Tax=Rhizopus TaxID=4842 RepID=A0A9P6ZAC2_9FUNG|nr:hypothetical protein G6F43_003112 [Rhizopus delemar]KAG1548461.1 hypothetical protein G6F51_003651 [Rhizopus arrhizus]KAG1463534.1 hypothetical protein G6F55_002333 [Rhizopus delemar]KAG1501615.1 hypothetical protein G6F54_002918 [Rhizopus delemar]KAG1515200.1 hypothetical protein G6F53_003095 [Rhizopus delemar]
MGNQASKVIEKQKEKNARKKSNRRKSTVTLGSHASVVVGGTISGNYDWIEDEGTSKSRRQSITEFFVGRNNKKSNNSIQGDFKELDRLQRQHYLLKSAKKSNTATQLDDSITIVDSGTGNGIWALEIAAEYTHSKVIALDLKPPTQEQGKPPNLFYKEADITKPWPIESNSVDFVFQRSMGHVIPKEHWHQLISEMYRVLKPGGTIELTESDLWHHNPGPMQRAFDEFFESQCDENGIDYRITETINKKIELVGFKELNHFTLDVPIGEWPEDEELKQFGFINKEIQKAFLRNRKDIYLSKWGMSSDDYDLAVQDMLNEFEEYKGFTRFNCYTAKKSQD